MEDPQKRPQFQQHLIGILCEKDMNHPWNIQLAKIK